MKYYKSALLLNEIFARSSTSSKKLPCKNWTGNLAQVAGKLIKFVEISREVFRYFWIRSWAQNLSSFVQGLFFQPLKIQLANYLIIKPTNKTFAKNISVEN